MKKSKDKSKKLSTRYFYQKWWFWVIIVLLFAGTWATILIQNINLRSSIIGILGIWGSTIATIFIGIIAACQNERYAFFSQKQGYIDSIREEECRFLEDFEKVGVASTYIELAIDLVYAKGDDDPKKEIALVARHIQIVNSLTGFMLTIPNYEYSPLYAKELWEQCEKMCKYLCETMNIAKMPNPLEDNFRDNGVDFATNITEWAEKMQEIKTKYALSYQVLINAVTKCKNMSALNKQMSRITEKTRKMREEIALFNRFEKQQNEIDKKEKT